MKKQHKTSIGGQAVIEGVMMRGVDKCSVAVRTPSGEIDIENLPVPSMKDKKWYQKVPFVRGIFNFVESMLLGYKCLSISVDKSELSDMGEPESKFEKMLTNKFGDKISNVIMIIGVVLGVALSLLMFMYLPVLICNLLEKIVPLGAFKTAVEGVIKICIFVAYMALTSLNSEIKTVFMYHGAEHKTIACYESGEELTVENARKQTRFHPRCGTSFIIIVLIVSIIVMSFIPTWNAVYRVGLKLLTLPLVMGIGYELIKIAGRYENIITKIFSYPGLLMQRITTREPTDSQLEVAIAALECAKEGAEGSDKW
jgi:uncharacterized protein YqhQ